MGESTMSCIKEESTVKALRLGTYESYLERPMQHLYPIKLTCNTTPTNKTTEVKLTDNKLIANASKSKSKRNAAVIVKLWIWEDFKS